MSIRRVEGQRLDVILQRLRESDKPVSLPDLQEIPEFGRRTSGRAERRDSIESLLADFIMPIISDPRIFHHNQAITLLKYLRDDVLPYMDDSEELTTLATKIIDDEIARHNLMQERRQSEIAV